MKILYTFLLSIFFCFSCADDKSKLHASNNEMVSLDSGTKSKQQSSDTLIKKEGKKETCLIKKITEENGQVYIHADYIQILSGERAIEEAKKRGDADTNMIDGKMIIGVPNDYYIINDNPKIRKLPLDPAAKFEFIENRDRYEGKVDNTLEGLKLIYENTPFVLTLKNERVIKVYEIYVP